MDIKTIVFLILVGAVTLYLFYPDALKINESFTGEEKKLPSTPKIHQSELHDLIGDSQFVGLPDELIPPWESELKGYGKIDDDWMENLDGNSGLGFNMCSKSCCSPQYPPPFHVPVDPLVCNSKDEFVPSSYTCNNGWQDSGCLCMTKKQSKFLGSRGGNTRQ